MGRDQDTDHRLVYETCRVPRGETKKEAEDPQAVLNEFAADGWRLVETIDYTGGGTKYLVFERPARSTGGEETRRTGNREEDDS